MHSDPFHGDNILIRHAARGDKTAFAKLYVQYAQIVRDLLASRTDDLQSSEDMTQEVFARAWQGARRFRGDSSVKTYLIAIAKNVLREHNEALRKRANTPALQPALDFPNDPAKSDCPCTCEDCPGLTGQEAISCQEDLRRICVTAIESVPPKAREAIALAIMHQLNSAEAAARAGCSTKTFRERLYRGLKKLRSSIADCKENSKDIRQ